jgi:hypothetical protein
VLLGEPMAEIASAYREDLLRDMGFDPEDAPEDLFSKETKRFMNKLSRQLGDRHHGDRRAGAALENWVRRVEEYDVFDALLSHFDFPSRPAVLARGNMLFPGTLTAHWRVAAGEEW